MFTADTFQSLVRRGTAAAVIVGSSLTGATATPPKPLTDDVGTAGLRQIGIRDHAARVTTGMHQQWHAALVPEVAVPSLPGSDPCQLPQATCSTPSPVVVTMSGQVTLQSAGGDGVVIVVASQGAGRQTVAVNQAAGFKLEMTPVDNVTAALQNWERGSQTQRPLQERDRVWLQRMNSPELSAHAVEAAGQLLGPVSATALREKYDWALVKSGNGRVTLSATPRDETDRLFIPNLEVILSSGTGTILGIAARERNGAGKTVQLPELAVNPVVLVQHTAPAVGVSQDDGLPPSPVPATPATIRFAGDAISIEMRQPR